MYILNDNKKYSCKSVARAKNSIKFYTDITNNLFGEIKLLSEDEFELLTITAEDYLRQEIGSGYLTLTNEPVSEPSMSNIEQMKKEKIIESKDKLNEYLEKNPIQFTNGKFYSVTKEKQALLTSQIMTYQLAINAGLSPVLTWNASGEECTQWSYENLCSLALSISNYVKPKVALQQAYEVQINSCKTQDEVKQIIINYEVITGETNH